jgi:2-methylisocitrate lyase-like PEP mutase family enzyme
VTERPTKILRRLISEPGVIIAPGVADALNARLVAAEGFKAIYMTGGGTSAVRLGMPDVGLLTMTEMVDNAGRIAEASGLPVISDADTGYGNQSLPKRCGHLAGKTLISTADMVAKIKAAVDARDDPDFMIIARTDALTVEGFEAALARGQAYEEAGADMIFVESPLSMEHLAAIPKAFKVPSLLNIASSGKTPQIGEAEINRLGFKLAIFPNFAILAAIPVVRAYLRELHKIGSVAHLTKNMASFAEWFDAVGMEEVKALEERYGTPEHMRTSYDPHP